MIKFYTFTLLLMLLSVFQARAQTQRVYKYAVFFKDKDTTHHRLSKPETFLSAKAIQRKKSRNISIDYADLPVNPSYLGQFASDTLFQLHNNSRWFNCAVIFSTQKNAIEQLKKYTGVVNVIDVGYSTVRKNKPAVVDLDQMVSALEQKFVRRNRNATDSSKNIYGAAFTQAKMINVPALHQQQLNGRGVLVAMIDAGYNKANEHPVFEYVFKNVVATYDFVDMEPNVFNDDDHGTSVWSCIAANDSFRFVGTAPQAGYVLLRSEDAPTEFPVEEFYWAMAAEYADSIGADIISSSLGYNEFGDPKYNYTHKQLNGKTSWITKAANLASAKGIFVVNSAGNEGDNMWKQITFPADANEVLSVGSVNKVGLLSDFSSIGLTSDKRIKPELMAMGEGVTIASNLGNIYTGNGTSYSCPVLSGGVACLWPQLSRFSNSEVKRLLLLSASSYNKPDKFFGYGIPDFVLVQKFAQQYIADTLIDVRMLGDKCLHIAMYINSKEKVHVTVKDASGKVIYTESRQLKTSGVVRFGLKKLKNTSAGKCLVEVTSGMRTFSEQVELN